MIKNQFIVCVVQIWTVNQSKCYQYSLYDTTTFSDNCLDFFIFKSEWTDLLCNIGVPDHYIVYVGDRLQQIIDFKRLIIIQVFKDRTLIDLYFYSLEFHRKVLRKPLRNDGILICCIIYDRFISIWFIYLGVR
jgi:hypothetical protein